MGIAKWKRKLTAGERAHINHTTQTGTFKQFQHNRAEQKRYGTKCLECEAIARKLGLEG